MKSDFEQRAKKFRDERNNAWDEFLDLSCQAGYNIKNTIANRSLFMAGYESGKEARAAINRDPPDTPVHVTQKEIDAVPDGDPRGWEKMVLDICHKVESMGASEELTELSIMTSNLRQSLAEFNKYCDDQFEDMCNKHPDLEHILRGKKPDASTQQTKEAID